MSRMSSGCVALLVFAALSVNCKKSEKNPTAAKAQEATTENSGASTNTATPPNTERRPTSPVPGAGRFPGMSGIRGSALALAPIAADEVKEFVAVIPDSKVTTPLAAVPTGKQVRQVSCVKGSDWAATIAKVKEQLVKQGFDVTDVPSRPGAKYALLTAKKGDLRASARVRGGEPAATPPAAAPAVAPACAATESELTYTFHKVTEVQNANGAAAPSGSRLPVPKSGEPPAAPTGTVGTAPAAPATPAPATP